MPLRPTMMLLALLCLAAALPARAEGKDADGCRDPRLVSRIPGAYISECTVHGYDEIPIPTSEEGPRETVAGTATVHRYYVLDKSAVQVVRNYQAALAKAGFALVWQGGSEGDRQVTLRRTRGARATVHVAAREIHRECEIVLTVIEEQAMTQEVSADASAPPDRDGHAALQAEGVPPGGAK